MKSNFKPEWMQDFVRMSAHIVNEKFSKDGVVPPIFLLAIDYETGERLVKGTQTKDYISRPNPDYSDEMNKLPWRIAAVPVPNQFMKDNESKQQLMDKLLEIMAESKPFAVAFITEAWSSKKNIEDGKRIQKEGYSKQTDLPSKSDNKKEIVLCQIETVMGTGINPIWEIIREGGDEKAKGILVEYNDDAKLLSLDIDSVDTYKKSEGMFSNFYEKCKARIQSKKANPEKEQALLDLIKKLDL